MRRSQRKELVALLRRMAIEPLPGLDGLLAPAVVAIALDGDPGLGARIMREFGRRCKERDEDVPMVVDLTQRDQRRLLVNRKLIVEKEIP